MQPSKPSNQKGRIDLVAFTMLMKKVAVVAALLLFFPFVVKAKDGNVAGWKPNERLETPESDLLTAPPFVFNVSETKEPVRVTLDLAAPEGYTSFMTELHQRLQQTVSRERWIWGSPVLGQQKWQPDTLIWVALKLGQRREMPTLAIRADNLYLVAFRPHRGPWYVFENTFWRVRPLLPGSIPLTFNDRYRSLTNGRGYRYLVRVDVGQWPALEAAQNLARYRQDQDGPITITEPEIKKALLTFVLMICEVERFTGIYSAVTAAWEHGHGHRIPKVEVELVVLWKNISCALLGWARPRSWQGIPEAHEIANYGNPKMTSPSNAAANLKFVLNATTCK